MTVLEIIGFITIYLFAVMTAIANRFGIDQWLGTWRY